MKAQRMAALKSVAELGAHRQRSDLAAHDANVMALEQRRRELGELASSYRRAAPGATSVAMLAHRHRFSASLVERLRSVDEHIDTVREQRTELERQVRTAMLRCESVKMLQRRISELEAIDQHRRENLADPLVSRSGTVCSEFTRSVSGRSELVHTRGSF